MMITAPFSHVTITAALISVIAGSALASAPDSISWETTTNEILLSNIASFNLSSPAHTLESSAGDLSKRSSWSTLVCNNMNSYFKPLTGGIWHFESAKCDRTGTNVNTFLVQCAGGRNWIEKHHDKSGQCGKGEWCFDIIGINNRGENTPDIICVPRGQIHTWTANTDLRPVDDHVTCSSKFTNDSPHPAHAKLAVDVMDSSGKDYIAPQTVFFTVNSKWVGHSQGGSAIVGSGKITIPPWSAVYACVTAIVGAKQILNIMAALTSLSVIP